MDDHFESKKRSHFDSKQVPFDLKSLIFAWNFEKKLCENGKKNIECAIKSKSRRGRMRGAIRKFRSRFSYLPSPVGAGDKVIGKRSALIDLPLECATHSTFTGYRSRVFRPYNDLRWSNVGQVCLIYRLRSLRDGRLAWAGLEPGQRKGPWTLLLGRYQRTTSQIFTAKATASQKPATNKPSSPPRRTDRERAASGNRSDKWKRRWSPLTTDSRLCMRFSHDTTQTPSNKPHWSPPSCHRDVV